MSVQDRPLLLRYSLPVVAVAVALLIFFQPALRGGVGSLLFFVVLLSAWYGGLGPGLVATGLVVVCLLSVALAKGTTLVFSHYLGLALFMIGGALVSILLEALHAARRGAEESAAEIRQHEETLRLSEERLQAILDYTPAVVFLKDRTGRYILVNRRFEQVMHLAGSQAVGKTDAELFPAVSAQNSVESDRKVLETGLPVEFEQTIAQADGSHTYLCTKFPLRDSGGTTYAICGMGADITDRKRAVDALKEADRHKDEFLAMLAHELRNPVAAISGAVRLLQEPVREDHWDWGKNVLERQSNQLARLIDDLLDVSRISRGKIRLRKQRVDLRTIVASAAAAMQAVLDLRSHRLVQSVDTAPLMVDGDPTRLEQVLLNLLTNAAKFTEPGGTIEVEARREGEDVVVSVRDTGVGIAPEMLPRIFDLFAQGDKTLDRSQGGLGIGLTLVRSLVSMHGGQVFAKSAGLGHGSEFTFRLPALDVASVTERPVVPAPVVEAIVRRILVVDDNVDMAQALGRLLQRAGHQVELAHDGPSALEVARTFHPDVALLDVGLPGMDGYALAQHLRQDDALQPITLVAISGYGHELDRGKGADSDFDHYMIKPVDIDALLALVAHAGSSHSMAVVA